MINSVGWSRRTISSEMSYPIPYDVPRSPVTTPRSQLRYCTTSGSVETELLAHERLVARGGVLAEENGHDVAAQHVDQREDHDRTDECCEQQREQRAQCVSQHRCVD